MRCHFIESDDHFPPNITIVRSITVGKKTKRKAISSYKYPLDTRGIIEDDILTVSGLPFLTKPKITEELAIRNYKAVKLVSGYWVLRDKVNIGN